MQQPQWPKNKRFYISCTHTFLEISWGASISRNPGPYSSRNQPEYKQIWLFKYQNRNIVLIWGNAHHLNRKFGVRNDNKITSIKRTILLKPFALAKSSAVWQSSLTSKAFAEHQIRTNNKVYTGHSTECTLTNKYKWYVHFYLSFLNSCWKNINPLRIYPSKWHI